MHIKERERKKGKTPRNEDALEQESDKINELIKRDRRRRQVRKEREESGEDRPEHKDAPPLIDDRSKSRGNARKRLDEWRRELKEE